MIEDVTEETEEHKKKLVDDFMVKEKETSFYRSSVASSVESRRSYLFSSLNSAPSLTASEIAGTEGREYKTSVNSAEEV